MIGELPPSPPNLFDSGHVNSNNLTVDVDITGPKELRLLVADIGSYSPERVLPVWAEHVRAGEIKQMRPEWVADALLYVITRPAGQIIDVVQVRTHH